MAGEGCIKVSVVSPKIISKVAGRVDELGEYTVNKEDVLPKEGSQSDPCCPICMEGPIDTLRYGGTACIPCKAFFWRTLVKGREEWRCKRKGNCDLTRVRRNNCPPCR